MAEKKVQKIKSQSDYLSDSKSSEDEVNSHLCTSQEERVYVTRQDFSWGKLRCGLAPFGGKR